MITSGQVPDALQKMLMTLKQLVLLTLFCDRSFSNKNFQGKINLIEITFTKGYDQNMQRVDGSKTKREIMRKLKINKNKIEIFLL